MARRPPPGRKRRTREHVIADLDVNHVERKVLECGHTLDLTRKDYGIDATLMTFGTDGEVENGVAELQVKATDHLNVSADDRTIALRVSGRDLKTWLLQVFPVIVVLYDAVNDRAFWLDIQEYARHPGIRAGDFRSVTIRIPVANRVTARAVRQWQDHKNRVWNDTIVRRLRDER